MGIIKQIIVSAVLAAFLLWHVFPKLICVLCEIILRMDKIIEYSKERMEDWSENMLIRIAFLCVYILSWGIMLLAFVPMIILTFIDSFVIE